MLHKKFTIMRYKALSKQLNTIKIEKGHQKITLIGCSGISKDIIKKVECLKKNTNITKKTSKKNREEKGIEMLIECQKLNTLIGCSKNSKNIS